MSYGIAQALPPANTVVSNGVVVFQSTHGGSIMNETSTPFQVIMNSLMTDSLGNSAPTTIISDIAQPNVALFLSANCEFPASGYASGSQVTFSVFTSISGGGVSESDSQTNTVTAP